MHLRKKIICYAILTIVCLSSLSGCTIEDLLFGTNFSLTSWDVCDDEGFPGLSIVFSSTGTIKIKLFGPNGTLLDSDLLFFGSNSTLLHLAHYRGTVTSGQYVLRTYDKNNYEIFEKTFSFNGPELSISSCTHKLWKQESWKDDYSLLTMKVYNKGDTPAYPYNAETNVNSKNYFGLILPSVILPGENKNIDCFVYNEEISEGATCTISLKDSTEGTIGNDTFSVVIEEDVPSKEFKWKYGGRNRRLSVPYPEFLSSYYGSIARSRLEDYSIYVFDLYDDDYIDLLIDRLMYGSNIENDVDKINFATSFVQNLEYKKDSETNGSFEYPRYPVETIFNDGGGGGDCEDMAILTACILDRMGYDIALFRLTEHMAVGVNLDENISSYEHYTDNYYFLETTASHKLGFIPSEYESKSNLTVYPISSRPLLIHEWKNSSITIFKETELGDFVKASLIVENLGSDTAENILITAGFYTQNNLELNVETKSILSLKPGVKEKITLMVDIPQDATTWFKTRVFLEDKIVNEKESASSFP